MVEVDAAKCKRAGITVSDVLGVLSGFIGGNYSSNLNRFSKLYRVMIQADKNYRLDKRVIEQYVCSYKQWRDGSCRTVFNLDKSLWS